MCLGLATTASLEAQTRRIALVPAEAPPGDFTDPQYVDSRGCAFMRAGSNGQTTWVPRFGDDRQPVCGMEPSQGYAATFPGPEPRPAVIEAPDEGETAIAAEESLLPAPEVAPATEEDFFTLRAAVHIPPRITVITQRGTVAQGGSGGGGNAPRATLTVIDNFSAVIYEPPEVAPHASAPVWRQARREVIVPVAAPPPPVPVLPGQTPDHQRVRQRG